MSVIWVWVLPNAESETRIYMRLVLGNDPMGQGWGIEEEGKTNPRNIMKLITTVGS